jgi:hypothetical protein
MITKEERKIIDTIIQRLHKKVIKTMKKIPEKEFYGFKEK